MRYLISLQLPPHEFLQRICRKYIISQGGNHFNMAVFSHRLFSQPYHHFALEKDRKIRVFVDVLYKLFIQVSHHFPCCHQVKYIHCPLLVTHVRAPDKRSIHEAAVINTHLWSSKQVYSWFQKQQVKGVDGTVNWNWGSLHSFSSVHLPSKEKLFLIIKHIHVTRIYT